MSDLKVTGTVVNVLPLETKNNFESQKIWLETDETYKQTLQIECGGKQSALFQNLVKGNKVEISVNLKGRIWQDKCFNTLSAWSVKILDNAPTAPTSGNYNPNDYKGMTPDNNNVDEVPF